MPPREAKPAPGYVLKSSLAAEGSGMYRAAPLPDRGGEVTVLVQFDCPEYPLENHCRYGRPSAAAGRRTFTGMEFRQFPPGLRVGPWPGWRGIPEMPDSSIVTGGVSLPLRFDWWGDELRLRRVRGVRSLEYAPGENVFVQSGDARLVPVSVFWYDCAPVRVVPVPPKTPAGLPATHPRLLLSPERVFELRSEESRAAALQKLRAVLRNAHLPFAKTQESKILTGPERLRTEDRMMIAAALAMLEDRGDDRDEAMTAFSQFLEETREPGYQPLQVDTQAGETLFLLCIGYDWLHDFLGDKERRLARDWMWQIAGRCGEFLPPSRTDVAQAHYLGCGLGLLAFSFLFREEHPNSAVWISQLRGALDRILAMLPDDGFHPHGGNLWIYEYGFLLRWLELFRDCAGEDLWDSTPHWKHASRFRAAMTTPDGLLGLTFGDPQYRIGGDSWCHWLIAARTGSPEAQWLGDRLSDLPIDGVDVRHAPPRRRVYELIFRDPLIRPVAPPGGVLSVEDGGQVFIRSDRGVCTVRCGPPIGVRRNAAGENGAYGHADPANGALLLYRNGVFVLSGPGPVYRRDTALHNCLTVDGIGQLGDGTVWLPDFFPPVHRPERPEVVIAGDITTITMDLTRAYLPDAGITRHTRSLVIDEELRIACIDLVACDAPRRIALNLHSWGSFKVVDVSSGTPYRFEIRDGAAVAARLLVDATCAVEWLTAPTEFVPAYPNDGRRDQSLTVHASLPEAAFLWCVTDPADPPFFPERTAPGAWRLLLGRRRVSFSGGSWNVLRDQP